jgi:hypothetical protein
MLAVVVEAHLMVERRAQEVLAAEEMGAPVLLLELALLEIPAVAEAVVEALLVVGMLAVQADLELLY